MTMRGGRARRTVLAEKVVGPADDELVDLVAEKLHGLVAALLLLVGRLAVATLEDGQLELLVELLLGAEVARVAEVEQREVLVEVVLCGEGERECKVLAREKERATSAPGWACR